jgi:hypothetical protein
MICTLANSLWLAGCTAEYARFLRDTRQVEQEQQAILQRILSENRDTEFGRQHGFSTIRSVADFQQRAPVRDYDQHREWIDRASFGIPNVLTQEKIRLFEPTGGSSGATKLIPYTASLQREFQKGIRAWIADLFGHTPALLGGQAYWSVTPVTETGRQTTGGIPIGFDDDTSYVGGWQRHLVNAVMAVPTQVRLTSGLDQFRYQTLRFLLRSRSLRLISIWNPSYLSLLLDRLPEFGDRIAHDIEHDEGCPAGHRRVREVRRALRANSPQDLYHALWPNLRVISSWADANAAAPAAKLAELFPRSRIQGKGLIATEAFVSFPLTNHDSPALAIRSHFFEFLPVGSDRPLLAHQLERGARYTVVVTTGGGLYRYQSGDLIEVTGRLNGCPLIRFLGRQESVADWFGEKLSDSHVSSVLEETFRSLALSPSFAMLACDTASPPGYVLYIDSPANDEILHRAADRIDAGLRANFHYDYARRLGQLCSVRPFRAPNGATIFLTTEMHNGRRLGDIKISSLDRRDGWSRVFGHFDSDQNRSRVGF